MSKRRTLVIIVGIVVVLLIAVRMALPTIVKNYVNRSLQSMQAYVGSVEDIDIHLWRGAYQINGLRIDKRASRINQSFFDCESIDLSLEWRSLLRGSVVAEAKFLRPQLNLIQSDNPQQSQTGTEQNWVDKLKELAPMRFNTVAVRDGRATFRVPGIAVKDALHAERINGEITNLTNVVSQQKETFSDFNLQGQVLNGAPLKVQGSVNPLAAQPTFDINLTLNGVQLPSVNPWLRKFIKADAESGQFELYVEMAAAKGAFKGYAKPLMQNVKIATSADDDEGALHRLWEHIVDVAAKIFSNKKDNQVAARIPFSGTLDDPHVGLFETILSVLRNAFVGAFSQSLENSISLHDVEKNLHNLDQDKPKDRQEKGKAK